MLFYFLLYFYGLKAKERLFMFVLFNKKDENRLNFLINFFFIITLFLTSATNRMPIALFLFSALI